MTVHSTPFLRAALRCGGGALVLALATAGCAGNRGESSGLFAPYRIDLPQGNYVTREMVDRVQPGMPREQVRAVLGTPLLSPVFRDDRWVYVFSYKQPSGRVEQRKVVVRFRGEQVESIEADELPPREDPTDPALPGARAAKARVDEAAKARGAQQGAAPSDKESSR